MQVSPKRRDREHGFTLIELMIASGLMVVVLGIVGGMLISFLTTESTVRSVTEASNIGQVTARSVTTDVRNSSDFRLTSPVGNDQMLVARTAEGEATLTWSCVAWYYSAEGDGSIWYKRSDVAILPPTPDELQTWLLLADGVQPTGGTAIFTDSGAKLTMAFKALAGDDPPVNITSSAVSRAGSSGSLTCF